ncbi:MAG: GNAT family N-acetyltransferase [Pseudomonadota bacterium]
MTVGTRSISPLAIPTVETDRLVLRGWCEADVDAVRVIGTDAEASRFIGGVAPSWQAFRTVCTFIGHWQMRGFGFFAVEERSSGQCIGWCGLWRPDGWPDNELGYSLIPSRWGKGYATDAARAALKFAYTQVGWTTAISCIDKDNFGSQGVARHLGATLEAEDVAVNDFRAQIWRHQSPNAFLEGVA